MNQLQINIEEIYAQLHIELEDLYAQGEISASIYNKKTPKRLLLGAINRADRHICLNIKLTNWVDLFVPAGQSTIFFARQKEYVQQFIDSYEEVKALDQGQYAYLITDQDHLDVISSHSQYATAYGEPPINAPKEGIRIESAVAEEVEMAGSKPKHRFYVDPNRRKLVMTKPFSENMWLRLQAQIAPVGLDVLKVSKAALEKYRIMAPHYCREWLIDRAMINLLSRRAAQAGGFYESEAKTMQEALSSMPGTGNVIIPGDELSGNYESNFEF